MDSLAQDLRFGLRSLRKHLGLTVVAVLSLGLGIGANTTVFTWLNAFVLNPLPAVAGFDRLVIVNTQGPRGAEWDVSYPNLRDWRAASQAVELAGTEFFQLGLREGSGTTERVWGVLATGNYFDVLRVRPALGRTLTLRDEEERAAVAVLGYSFWQRRFAGDSGIIGRHLSLNGRDVEIVGVAPPRFGGVIIALQMDLYLPLTLQPALVGRSRLDQRQWQWLDGFARIRDGYTLAQARADLDGVVRRTAEATGDGDSRNGAILRPMSDQDANRVMLPVFLAMLGITGVVLLIACSNVASLLLARALARRREIGIRLALGAGRFRLVRQLLTESLVLALAAGAVGMLVALWGRDLVMKVLPPTQFPIGLDLVITPGVLLFALAVTLVTSLLFGLMPAVQASRPDVVPSLKDTIGSEPGRRSRLQSALVVSQVALALVSLVCAGLFMRSLQASRSADVGFRSPEQVLLVSTDLQLAGVPDSQRAAVVNRLLDAVRAVPGVAVASVASDVPLGFGGASWRGMFPEGYQPAPDENMAMLYSMVGPDYFRAMDLPILRGRPISDEDRAGAPPVMVVNERFAERYWPGQDPVGRRVRLGFDGTWFTVVGLAKQGKYASLTEAPVPMAWMSLLQEARSGLTLHVRTTGEPPALTATLRAVFQSVSADLPFLDVRTMHEHMQAAVVAQRLGAIMLAGFGLVALALSAMGIYGVLSFGVRQRTREIGVRVALGAARRDVMGLVVGRAVRLAGLGLALGLAAALGAAQLLRSQLIGVSPRDPVTFLAIAALLGVVALAAAVIPARRASRVDAMVALRSE